MKKGIMFQQLFALIFVHIPETNFRVIESFMVTHHYFFKIVAREIKMSHICRLIRIKPFFKFKRKPLLTKTLLIRIADTINK